MSMYQVGDACYATPSAALSAMASRMFGTAISETGQQYSYFTTVQDGNLITHSSLGSQIVVTPELQNCNLITPDMASIYSFAVIAVWATVWAFVVLRRGLHDNHP